MLKVAQDSCDVTHRQAYTPVMSMLQKAVEGTHCTLCIQPAGMCSLLGSGLETGHPDQGPASFIHFAMLKT